MASEKIKHAHAYAVFAGCCCIGVGGYSLAYSSVGVYLLPMSAALGLGVEAISIYLVIDAVIEVFVLPFVGRALSGDHIRFWLSFGVVVAACSFISLGTANAMWQIVLAGVLSGIGMPFLYNLPQDTLIGNWFAPRYRGRFLGVAIGFQDLAAVLWPLVFGALILLVGWRACYFIQAALALVFILPWTLFVFKRTPQEMGLQPYGADAAGLTVAADAPAATDHDWPTRKALASRLFWLVLISVAIQALGYGFIQSSTFYAEELFSATMASNSIAALGATAISLAALGGLIGSVVYGFIRDKLGERLALFIFLAMYALAFAVLVLLHSPAGMLIGGFLLGTQDGMICVGYPMLVRGHVGSTNYSKIYSYVIVANVLVGNSSIAMLAFFHNLLGGYGELYVVGLVLALVCIALAVGIARFDAHGAK